MERDDVFVQSRALRALVVIALLKASRPLKWFW